MAIFKPRARLLLELGNQLIRNENIAIFELSKNSYDADATNVTIELENIDSKESGRITIEDNGSGMDLDIVENVWLEPGTDYREKQIKEGRKSRKFKRLPLGQKGIGRFAVHKLGKKIKIITKKENSKECVICIDWRDFENKEYLEDVEIEVRERDEEYFLGSRTGTKIIIEELSTVWTKKMTRDVYRTINSICSDKKYYGSFHIKVNLKDTDKQDWLEKLISAKEMSDLSLFKMNCKIEGNKLKYKYEFSPENYGLQKIKGRVEEEDDKKMETFGRKESDKEVIDLGEVNLGNISFELCMYDLDSLVLQDAINIQDKAGFKKYLSENGGIKVYRDGIRIFNYGEREDDWLELNSRRVNSPGERISKNLVLGSIYLDIEKSEPLKEKTNREGFIEDDAYHLFKKAILFCVREAELCREEDKDRLKNLYTKENKREVVLDSINELRLKFKEEGVEKKFSQELDKIEKGFIDIRDNLIMTSGAGLSYSIAIHEIQKVILELKERTENFEESEIKDLIKYLHGLLQNYSSLITLDKKKENNLSELVEKALLSVNYRLKAHKVEVIKNLTNLEVKCHASFIISAIMNLIDNALWWTINKNESNRQLYLSTEVIDGHPAIIVGDNGPGLKKDLEYLKKPFISYKPLGVGMGLGLHVISQTMHMHKGRLIELERQDYNIPENIDGAIIAMVF